MTFSTSRQDAKDLCKGFLPFALILWFLAGPLPAAQTLFSSSTRQDPFETAGVSARAMAMGKAFVGVSDDSAAVLFNPAGLAGPSHAEISVHHLEGLAGIRQDVIATSLPVGGDLGFGAYGHYIDYGKFEGNDEEGNPTGEYGANQMGLGAGAALRVLERLSLGLALRANQQTLASESYALFNADAGMMIALDSGWRLGAAYCNLGLSGRSASAATAFRIGASQAFGTGKPFTLLAAVAGSIEPRTGNNLLLGMEGGFRSAYYIRAGYRMRLRETGLDGIRGVTAGAGVQYKSLRLDYAFEPFGDVGGTNRFSLVHQFGSRPVPAAAVTAPAPVTVIQTIFQPVPAPAPAAPMVVPEPVQPGTDPSKELTVKFSLTSEEVARGEEMEKQGQMQEAFRSYLKAVQQDKRNAKAWWKLGNLYYRSRMKEQAVRCFEEVLRLTPDNRTLADWLNQYKAQPVPSPQP